MKRRKAGNRDILKWCLNDPRERAAAWRCISKFTLDSTSGGSAQAGAFFLWGRATRVCNNIRVVLMQVGAAGASVWLEPWKGNLSLV